MTFAAVSKVTLSSAAAIGGPISGYFIYDHIKNSHLSSLDREILKNIKDKAFTVGEFSDPTSSGDNKSVSSEVKVSITSREQSKEWKCNVKAVAVKSGADSVDLTSSKEELKNKLSSVLGNTSEGNADKKWYFVWNCALNRAEDKVDEGKESELVLELQKKSADPSKWEFKDLDRVFTGAFENFVVKTSTQK